MNRYQKEGKMGDGFMNLFPKLIFLIFLSPMSFLAALFPVVVFIIILIIITIGKSIRHKRDFMFC